MNDILAQVDKYMHEALESRLPQVSKAELEDNGAVFYMNGKNGTAFDWYVNEHFPCFFIFYNDEENLGAVQAILHCNGRLSVYVYGDKGHADPEETVHTVDASADQLICLAAFLTENADEKKIWDAHIRDLPDNDMSDDRSVGIFLENKKYYIPMIERRKLWDMTAIVSAKVRAEGWKIGYGVRGEPTREGDSGWFFGAGSETDDYVNDANNLELWKIGSVLMYDPALNELINVPYGTSIIRVDHDKFETDGPDKEMLIEKVQPEPDMS